MWTAQTPQGFSYDRILKAHREAHATAAENLTDDASVAERARRLDEDGEPELDHDTWVDDLVAMCAAVVTA